MVLHRFSNNDFTLANFNMLLDGLYKTNVSTMFLDWNNIQDADYSKILDNPKIINLYLRSNSISDNMVELI